MFLGEHAWSPAHSFFHRQREREGGVEIGHGCPAKLRITTLQYLREANGFDCSVDDSYTLQLASNDLVVGLGLHWSGNGADFIDSAGRLVALDPTAHADGPSAFLIREESLRGFLERKGLSICWCVLGEKRIVQPGFGPKGYDSLRVSGAYVLGDPRAAWFPEVYVDRLGENEARISA